RRAPLLAPRGPRGRLGAAAPLRLPHERQVPRERPVRGYRPLPAGRRARLPDARAAARPRREPPALRVRARLQWPLLRGLAAAGSLATDDPRAPPARRREPGGRRPALFGRAQARPSAAGEDARHRDPPDGDLARLSADLRRE